MTACNIDARGRRMRRVGGMITLVISLILFLLDAFGLTPAWVIYLAIGTLIIGLFQIYEAKHGWCALRAMGVKTPI